jgi:glucosamine--fructose-6-phosphate aminotransferase (isomerizing)
MTKLPDTEPEWLIPIFSILPAYIFTYYLAISKGINPDIMRMNDERYLEARGMMRKSIE